MDLLDMFFMVGKESERKGVSNYQSNTYGEIDRWRSSYQYRSDQELVVIMFDMSNSFYQKEAAHELLRERGIVQ
jgi:hypothetical protein